MQDPALSRLRAALNDIVRGKPEVVDLTLVAVLARGHILLEDVPGVGKTTLAQALARGLGCSFKRIQFTSDLLPGDILGVNIFVQQSGAFEFRPGPIFGNIVLADEINRAPAKVQSALLEAMQERQVTLAETTHPLPEPFLVLATQNPIEQEGTYPLPEAQVDRFMMKLLVTYPTQEEERQVLERSSLPVDRARPVLTPQRLIELQQLCRRVTLKPVLQSYIVSLVHATRQPGSVSQRLSRFVQFGASPRATIALAAGARAIALMDGRDFATPDDVKEIAADVLRHRLLLTYEAEAEGLSPDAVIREILASVRTP